MAGTADASISPTDFGVLFNPTGLDGHGLTFRNPKSVYHPVKRKEKRFRERFTLALPAALRAQPSNLGRMVFAVPGVIAQGRTEGYRLAALGMEEGAGKLLVA